MTGMRASSGQIRLAGGSRPPLSVNRSPNGTPRCSARGAGQILPASAARTIRRRYADGQVSLADLAEEYRVGRSTIHHIIHRPESGVPAPSA
jgi:hypothetical protein